jgi:hypothetical protein
MEPLLDIKFTAMELDFFAAVDNQYIRVFTVVSDVHLPIGLQVGGMGDLTPVIGNPADAFTNLSVKNTEAVTETPAELAGLFPTLLSLVLPQLSGGLGSIALPNLGGLALSVTDITAVDNDNFLAIFGNLVPATMPRPVRTTVEITGVTEPADAIARDPARWRDNRPPAVTLALGAEVERGGFTPPRGIDAADLEWSIRIDEGSWSAWSANPRPTISPRTFWLPGNHHLEVRARQIGHPETIDTDPVKLEIPLGTAVPTADDTRALARAGGPAPFHGQPGGAGCACNTGGRGAVGSLPLVLVIGLVLVPLRRVRRRLRSVAREAIRLGPLVWLVAIACLPGCSCGSNPCGDADCLPGAVERGAVGRWTSIADDDKRVMVAIGDLVVVDATDPTNLQYTAVDGIPEITPTYDPGTYRGGIVDPGPNIGAWTSIVLAGHKARVAYQDRDELALMYAYETSEGHWKHYPVDTSTDLQVGEYTSMVMDASGKPAIAYVAYGVDDGMGHRTTELRLARATKGDPASETQWSSTTIASAPGTCASLCPTGQACVAGAAATDPQVCITPTSDCTAACATGEACSTGSCVATLEAKLADIGTGTGLFAHMNLLPDGRLAVVYYDRVRRALVLSSESAAGSSQFQDTILDGNVDGADRGMWSNAAVGGDGTLHIAYQDAIGDQLMYVSWNGTPGVPEVVDDGVRAGDRPHPVGAAAAVYIVSGSPAIAYQDGLDADVMLATRGSTWSTMDLTSGPLLDGFSIAATTGHGTPVLAWDSLDPAAAPPNGLVVRSP